MAADIAQLKNQLLKLREEREAKVKEKLESCPSHWYREYDDPSSTYSEMIHAETTTTLIAQLYDEYKAKANEIVNLWVRQARQEGMGSTEALDLAHNVREEVDK